MTGVRSIRRTTVRSILIGGLVGAVGLLLVLSPAPSTTAQSGALYPDLQTVVPGGLRVESRAGWSKIFFTNVIANLGSGRLQIRGEHTQTVTVAYQQLLNAAGQLVSEFPVSIFEFHPAHGHWHIDNVARYELRAVALGGAVVAQAIKVTFCMIDTERLLRRDLAAPANYFSCNGRFQGITNGWGDEYVYRLPGQELPITGLPAGIYYLISTSDPSNQFSESNDDNNTAWVKLQLSYVDGRPAITELDHSPCEGVMCGNRPGSP